MTTRLPRWVHTSQNRIPEDAVTIEVGPHGSKTYITRMVYNGETVIMPIVRFGPQDPSEGFDMFEVLCASQPMRLIWKNSMLGEVEEGAVSSGDSISIGRIRINESYALGNVIHSRRCLEVYVDGRLQIEQQYQVMILKELRSFDFEVFNLLRHVAQVLEMPMEIGCDFSELVEPQPTVIPQSISESETDNEIEPENPCIICMAKEINCALYRCGHASFCYGCAKKIQLINKTCPVCRSPIDDILRIH